MRIPLLKRGKPYEEVVKKALERERELKREKEVEEKLEIEMNVPKLKYIICFLIIVVVIASLLFLGNPHYTKAIIKNDFMTLESDEKISESNIYLYNNQGGQILRFNPWEMRLTYKGITKYLFAYGSTTTLFNENDSKSVKVGDNKMMITYSNPEKDPSEVKVIFTLRNNTVNYKIECNFSESSVSR